MTRISWFTRSLITTTSDHPLYLDRLVVWPVVAIEYSMIRAAAELSSGTQIQFWDALIVVAAFRAGATRLYTEDLNHGQVLMGVEIVNPFRVS